MKTRHWIEMTGLTCAALGVALLPPRPTRQVRWSPQLDPEYRVGLRVGANYRLQVEAVAFLEARDAAMALLDDRDAPSHLVMGSTLPEVIGDKLERMLVRDSTLASLANSPAWAVAVFPRGFRPLAEDRIRYFLPSSTDGRTCLSVVLLGTASVDSARAAPRAAEYALPYRAVELLGPCASVGQFGPPGPAVSEWLASGAIEDPGDYASRCRRGRLDGCRDLLIGGNERRIANGADEFSVMGPSRPLFGAPRHAPRFDRGDHAFLLVLAESIGRETMIDLWTSDAPLERALAEAVASPIDEWMRDYARSASGNRIRDTAPLSSSTFWQVLATIAGAWSLAVVIGTGRQASPG